MINIKTIAFLVLPLFVFTEFVLAFPPAPHHLFYGMLRDELGQPLSSSSATVIIESESGIQISAPLTPGVHPGINYKITVPMDSGVTADPHKQTALSFGLPFKIKVQIGQTILLPIEMSGDFANLGIPGGETRLNLNLGQDTDGDGLADLWEEELIRLANDPLITSILDVKPDGDIDGDGMTNLDEYLAGTQAFDEASRLSMIFRRTAEGKLVYEVLAPPGRTYTLYGSLDLQQWSVVPFRLVGDDPDAAPRQNYYSTAVRVIQMEVSADSISTGIFDQSGQPVIPIAHGIGYFRLKVD